MDTKDYYQVMGLEKNATPQDIKMAYRRLARKYHPDLNKAPDAEENFKALGEAYEVLHDPQKRQAYDAGEAEAAYRDSTASHTPHSEHAWSDWTGDFAGDEDWLASLFGAKRRGVDWHGSIRITLREAFSGVVKELVLSGDKSSAKQSIRVKIPAGVKADQQIRLAGMGGSNGRLRGDLYLKVCIERDPLFDVVGNDVYLTLPITPWEAALGATVAVPTLAGSVDLKIPPHSQGGQKLRLKRRGLPATVPGDQYVLLNIVIPEPTTPKAESLYQRMAEEMPFNPRASMEKQHD